MAAEFSAMKDRFRLAASVAPFPASVGLLAQWHFPFGSLDCSTLNLALLALMENSLLPTLSSAGSVRQLSFGNEEQRR
jgi:hypothetical protein